MSVDEKEVQIEQKVAEFSQQNAWLNVDSYIDYVGLSELKYETTNPQEEKQSEQSFFTLLDYIPNTDNVLISDDSIKDIISIKSENDVFLQIKYNDKYGNEISEGYPKLYYRKQSSSDSWTEKLFNPSGNNLFNMELPLEYGNYEYYVVADNENYPDEYISPTKLIIVSERPHSFKNLNLSLQDGKGNSNTNLNFRWTVAKGVESDILKYTLFLGTDENSMQQYDLATEDFYTAGNLSPRTRYYWRVEVENQYGIKMLNPITFDFVTLGEIKKVYNAPNPFNPQKGQTTRIFFEMSKEGKAELDIYSEYGDKIYHTVKANLSQGNNEIVYDGKDDYGNILYNGTYLCVIKKKYSDGGSKTERCRLLIIK
ncbi:hypothetical protein [Candidatus Ruminimicrobiellum ovillum]|uniref:hypothetical protein n=1 Tax=Candidatus Ruminimicrobiellum ovillum TaxID=1947927 RepID=UPI00355A6BB9